jgi:ornithine decarboxylase
MFVVIKKTLTLSCALVNCFVYFIFMFCSLILRIRCEAKNAQCPLGAKFGCDPVTEAPKLLKAAKNMNLNVIGISFHVGSGCRDYPVYYKAIGICKGLFDEGESLGFNMRVLDIGGGFPGDNDKTIDEVAMIINQGIEAFFSGGKNICVIAEPGRFYVASAFTLVTNVYSRKNIYNPLTNDLDRIMLYVNDGVYGSFNCILYDHQVVAPKLLNRNKENEKKVMSTIFGPTCDALDTIIDNIPMPESMDIGDFIYFENMGAYTIPVASAFNGFPLPKIYCYIQRDFWQMIRSLLPLDADDYIEDYIGKTIELVSA